MKIAFFCETLCLRGTSTALYDYAHYNEKILKNESMIMYDSEKISEPDAIEKFEKRFLLFPCKKDNIDTVLEQEHCDILYVIKYGKNDGYLSKKVKTVIHCVFSMRDPHGDVYAGVSQSIAKKFDQDKYVPHICHLEDNSGDNMRSELNIPENAIVFGRSGGKDTFDLLFCWDVIRVISEKRKGSSRPIYFVFVNTEEIVTHKNIKYISKIVNNKDKIKFIKTCDAVLECGSMGHSFGLTLGEFSIFNKPAICYLPYESFFWNDEHVRILQHKGIYYRDGEEFYNILNEFNPEYHQSKDNNCYKEFNPENVMNIFKKVFIDNCKEL